MATCPGFKNATQINEELTMVSLINYEVLKRGKASGLHLFSLFDAKTSSQLWLKSTQKLLNLLKL